MCKMIIRVGVLASTLLCTNVVNAAEPVQQQLKRLEERLTEALSRADAGAVDALWADDLVWIGLNGQPSTKAQRLAAMQASGAIAATLSVTNKHIEVKVYGSTAVVTVLSTWTNRAEREESATDYVATHVWNRQHGRWHLVSAHISRLS